MNFVGSPAFTLRYIPAREDIDTLGGLAFSIAGRIPARGERVRHASGVEFEVLEADRRRIKKLRIHLPPAQDAAKPEDKES